MQHTNRPYTPPEQSDSAGTDNGRYSTNTAPAVCKQPPSPPATPTPNPKRQSQTRSSRAQLEAHRAIRRARERSQSAPNSNSATATSPKSEVHEAKSLSRTGGQHRATTSTGELEAKRNSKDGPLGNELRGMAFAEQQKWITVQQKTFTKWLNTKIQEREVEVKDLVKDLSDGVRLDIT